MQREARIFHGKCFPHPRGRFDESSDARGRSGEYEAGLFARCVYEILPPNEPGVSDLELTIHSQKQVHGSLSFDDSGMKETGKDQLQPVLDLIECSMPMMSYTYPIR